MAPSEQSTTITHPHPTWKEQLSLRRGTTFCAPYPNHGQKAQQKQRCSSSKPVNTVQVRHHLIVLHLASGDVAAGLSHLKPAEVPHRARGSRNRSLDRILNTDLRCPDKFDDFVDVIMHPR